MRVRRLITVLGDQLSFRSAAFSGADPERDLVVMAEVDGEIRRFPNHKQRVAFFLSAMRHFRDELRTRGFRVRYQSVDDRGAAPDLPSALARAVEDIAPDEVVMTDPGRLDLQRELARAVEGRGSTLDVREDDSFLCSHAEFDSWARGRRTLTMEYFYRTMRKRTGVLMDGAEPAEGRWNFDEANREAFRGDPGEIKAPIRFRPDGITGGVLELVRRRYSDLPGSVDRFDWPVTHDEARRAVLDFVEHRLPNFGTYQDAMWTGRPYLYHARIAAALNVKLIHPRYVIEKVEDAYREGWAPINAVEGFIRQILGWREFIRGVYWLHMPGYEESNGLGHGRELPDLFWTGETEMACLRETVRQLLRHGYAHHIQRLMVAGLFAQLYGTRPQEVHDWFMAMYVDSVEWVTLPNTVGMSQHADGGIVGTKPYIASGRYIQRQSDHCGACRYDPGEAVGERACPFTTLYWDFLERHADRFRGNRRMTFQIRNLERKSDEERGSIRRRAEIVRRAVREGSA